MLLKKLITLQILSLTSLPLAHADVDALHVDWINPKLSLSDDFYSYANNGWQMKNPIPPEYSTWNNPTIMSLENRKRIHHILMDASENKSAASGSIEQKIGDFYFSGMDEKMIEAQGIQPLKPELERIQNIQNLQDLQTVVTHLHLIGVGALFYFSSMQDFQNSEDMIAAVFQGGLGLPDRDYYTQDNKRFVEIRKAYLEHLHNLFVLLGESSNTATQYANVVMGIENSLAKASLTQAEARDPHAIYHMMTETQIAELCPQFSWGKYFSAMGQSNLKTLNVGTPTFFQALNQQLKTIPLEDWKIYLKAHLISAFSDNLSQAFVDENFDFSSKVSGTTKMKPRWERVVIEANSSLDFAVGEEYVKQYFSAEDKAQVKNIVDNIRHALYEDIQSLAWMTPSTRKAALQKLDKMEERIGYPSKWWDYSSLKIDRGPYVLNVLRANEFLVKRELDKIGKPIDRSEWSMPPQSINAYYDPSMNQITLLAGILQPPFFTRSAPAAINYGAIGFVVGHEMTHGFDDAGAQFDGDGNLKNWWSKEDLKQFQAATNCIIKQYSQYRVDDLPVQGKLVAGEATADLGGLILAYRAFQHSDAYKTAKTIEGFTPDQQFFLAAAHVWASSTRAKARYAQTMDPHPPEIYRVNGSFMNIPAFQAAFKIPEGSLMAPKERCVIW